MSTLQKYTPFYVATLLLCVVLFIIYPYCQYYIDPDGIAYFTIAHRYASGDYLKAINGLWSPCSCWLVALLLKTGLAAMPAAVLVNAVAAVGMAYISQSFFLHFNINRKLQWMLMFALAVFLCYAVFIQLFEDLWQFFFLLSVFRMMLNKAFAEKPILWVIGGMVGALAYFAKGYSFPFFLLNTVCCTYFLVDAKQIKNHALWVKICWVMIATMLLCSAGWLYMLHSKYGIWTTSTSGALNTSWYLVGHAIWKPEIHYLLPPVYSDSPYFWEDPYLLVGATPQFWHSPSLFVMECVRICYRILGMVDCMNDISCCLFPLWLLAICIVVSKKVRAYFAPQIFLVALTIVLFPSGYLMSHFEARYIWYMLPLSMVLGAMVLDKLLVYVSKNWLKQLIMVAFCFSYGCFPIADLKNIINVGKDDYRMANELKQAGIKGTFAANVVINKDVQKVARIAYFSGNPYYNIQNTDFLPQELLQEMRRYKVKYYFYFHSAMDGSNYKLVDEQGKSFPEQDMQGLTIFTVNP